VSSPPWTGRTLTFPARIAPILPKALAVRDRRGATTISAHGVDVARGHLFEQVLKALG
jgi:hypothetical protein